MKNKKTIVICTISMLALLLLTLAGCSGGSGGTTTGTTLKGTAAAGAPIIGTVTIKDSTTPIAQTATVPIVAGTYTVDVAALGLKAPYMVRADGYVGGNEYHLYSAGTSADVGGTINITPLTDLIVANIAGTVAKTYFDNGSFSNLTATQLTDQADALKAKLLPVLQAVGVSDSIDLLRASFSTDHTGLDAALDLIKVTTNTTTNVATITNIITQQQITSNISTGTMSGVLDNTTGVATGVTDVQAIAKSFDDFSALFATSLPAATNAQLLAFFDQATFMHDGRNLAAFLSDITTDPSTIGLKFSNVSVSSLDPVAGTGEVEFEVIIQGRMQVETHNSFKMVKKNGVWLMQGNQRLAKVDIEVRSEYHPGNTTAQIQSGLYLNIQDRGGKGIDNAVVTGPGLPTAGVLLANNIEFSQFTIQAPINNVGGGWYPMDDTTIGTIADGSTYTIVLRNATNGVMATYTESIKKRPYKVSELTAASFPAITAPTQTAFRAFSGGNLVVTWTIPSGLQSDFVFLFLNGDVGNASVEKSPLAPTTTTVTLAIQPQTSTGTTFAITSRNLEVGTLDSYGRYLITTLY